MTKTKILLILSLLSLYSGISFSQDNLTNRFANIDSYFNEQISNKKLAGAITLIAIDHKIEHLKSYGFLDVEKAIPMNNDVIIPIASMTKIITTIAILKLYEDGKLQLDDAVEKFIPEFGEMKVLVNPNSTQTEDIKSKPTIRDLLRHTSGIVYSSGKSVTDSLYFEAGFREWNGSLRDFVLKVTEIPLAFQPSENWIYSYSHDVLGYLVEVVSKMPLNEFFTKYIFQPLGMENTDFYVPIEKANKLSNLYNYDNGVLKIDDSRENSIYHKFPHALSGGGGWWSSYCGIVTTIKEFNILSSLLLNYGQNNNMRILERQTVELMISNQIGDLNAYGNKYGLGVGIKKTSDADEKVIFWAGAPYNTYFWIDYQKKLVGILFTNTAPFGHLGMMDKFDELTNQAIENN